MRNRSGLFLKRALLFFWSVWLTIVFATNVCDACKYLGLLADSWTFASGNYAYIVKTTAIYKPPDWVNQLLFLGVLCWEGTTTALFWLSWWTYRGKEETETATVTFAFTLGLSLWMCFAIAAEVFIKYDVEATHWRLFIAQLATLLAIELLPDEVTPWPTSG